MTLTIMTILKTINMADISYNDITNKLFYSYKRLCLLKITYDVKYINVISKFKDFCWYCCSAMPTAMQGLKPSNLG